MFFLNFGDRWSPNWKNVIFQGFDQYLKNHSQTGLPWAPPTNPRTPRVCGKGFRDFNNQFQYLSYHPGMHSSRASKNRNSPHFQNFSSFLQYLRAAQNQLILGRMSMLTSKLTKNAGMCPNSMRSKYDRDVIMVFAIHMKK